MVGMLEIVVGPMFAGKTTELVKKALYLSTQNKLILVFKPAFDTRETENIIRTHSGANIRAQRVDNSSIIFDYVQGSSVKWVFIDEAQFYDDKLSENVRKILLYGANVFATGLDMNYKGEPFTNTALLMAQADKVTKLQAYCSLCGQPASKTMKKKGSTDSLEVGALDLYEPRCNEHWEIF